MRLQGKIGIVTAATCGMRRAGALRFADGGAAVAAAGVDAVVGQIKAADGKAIGIVGDPTREDFARDIVRQTAKAFGGSVSSGTMSAILAPRRSRASIWPNSTSR